MNEEAAGEEEEEKKKEKSHPPHTVDPSRMRLRFCSVQSILIVAATTTTTTTTGYYRGSSSYSPLPLRLVKTGANANTGLMLQVTTAELTLYKPVFFFYCYQSGAARSLVDGRSSAKPQLGMCGFVVHFEDNGCYIQYLTRGK